MEVHMQRLRVGAPRHVTCFLLHGADLLQELRATEQSQHVDLPRTGKELADVLDIWMNNQIYASEHGS